MNCRLAKDSAGCTTAAAFLNAVVSGWHVSGLFKYYSGQPFQAVVANPYYLAWGTSIQTSI